MPPLILPEPPAPVAAPDPNALTYGQMKLAHDEWDGKLWHRLDLLHRGGWAIQKEAHLFLEKAPLEPGPYFEWRKKNTSYVNHFAKLVGFLMGSLFQEALIVKPDEEGAKPDKFYDGFAKNCDRNRTDFSQFMRTVTTDALVMRRAIVGIDMPVAPAADEEPANRAQSDAEGIGAAWLYRVPIASLINWEKDDEGWFTACVLHTIERPPYNPFRGNAQYRHRFKVWQRLETGQVVYSVLRTKLVTREEELTDTDVLEWVAQEKPTTFTQIPLLELELPEALWAGNQAGPLCQEHFRRRSDLFGSMARSLVEIPYVKRGAEVPPVNGGISETQSDPNRGADPVGRARQDGWVGIGADDELGFAGPSGVAYTLADTSAKDVREEIYASLNAMALQLANSAAAVGRSGESKAEDRGSLGIILSYLAVAVTEFAQLVYEQVSAARNEPDQKWSAAGLNTLDADDRGLLVEESIELEQVRIPSVKWLQLRRINLALATVPKATQAERQEIIKQIIANTMPEEAEATPAEKAAEMTEATNPKPDDGEEPNGPPAKKAPAGKK